MMNKRNRIKLSYMSNDNAIIVTDHFSVSINVTGIEDDIRSPNQKGDTFLFMRYTVTSRTTYATKYKIKKFLRKFLRTAIDNAISMGELNK